MAGAAPVASSPVPAPAAFTFGHSQTMQIRRVLSTTDVPPPARTLEEALKMTKTKPRVVLAAVLFARTVQRPQQQSDASSRPRQLCLWNSILGTCSWLTESKLFLLLRFLVRLEGEGGGYVSFTLGWGILGLGQKPNFAIFLADFIFAKGMQMKTNFFAFFFLFA